ncbi:ATP-binding protein [Zhihengliuella salsuginis]|uniref:Histidine kinase-, DNA gyrase B-, and HSP90-like ATPase n=1 Tax=Zhihengliuella salsuginis TaxID=578222 RepID=A0ABQ3GH12_9MICC|nr:ATP-binding protein [Zhihengliuella salsuginis]GHD06199.1 hypothetical protein GCM10008096_15890 [Zhihengliuella salsuginis]
MTEEQLDLTPSPRILDVIADVDMSVEECLAELIDNALDELASARRDKPGFEGEVEIDLPYGASVTSESVISVTDTGRGMSSEQMRNALRAGSSGNDRYGSLGLFGMGFNVATGRLGYVTTIRSGRSDETWWTIATIDIQAMGSEDSFQVPLAREPKAIGEHGTTVGVSRLRSDTVKRLGWNGIASRVRSRIGETYSYMLRNVTGTVIAGAEVIGGLGLGLRLNGEAVKPYIPCIWSSERSVLYKGQHVSAVVEINEQLGLAFACSDCGHWHSPEMRDLEQCVECGSNRIEQRAREIRGWLGIQRYDDANDFGISLLREGRTIRHLDKGLFDWLNSDTGERFTEYPAELGRGRIVGELHLDHLPVNYRKTDFGRDTVAWRAVVEKVRGFGPLQEQRAKQLSFESNSSRLGMLFHAYRRYDPGYRYLVPGNGEKAMADKARTWARYFREGLTDYQSDEMWWRYVVNHEEIKAGFADADDGGDLDNTNIADLLPDSGGDADEKDTLGGSDGATEQPNTPAMETRDDRLARFRASGRIIPQLDAALIVIPDDTTTIKVTAYITKGVELPDGFSNANLEAGVIEIFLDSRHTLLAEYGWNPVDVAITVFHDYAAGYLGYKGRAGVFVSRVLEQVGDRKIDAATVRASAEGILSQLREAVVSVIKEDPTGIWSRLSPAAKTETQKIAANAADQADWNSLVDSGEYSEHLSARAIEDLALEMPEQMLDGGVFATTYASWQDEVIREERLTHVTSLLRDLQRMLSATDRLSPRELLRLSIGLETLDGVVSEQNGPDSNG